MKRAGGAWPRAASRSPSCSSSRPSLHRLDQSSLLPRRLPAIA
jgi:hypothetical protein